MIVFEFDNPNFTAQEGSAEIIIRDGRLTLQGEPGQEVLDLIEMYGGRRVEAKSKRKSVEPIEVPAEKAGE